MSFFVLGSLDLDGSCGIAEDTFDLRLLRVVSDVVSRSDDRDFEDDIPFVGETVGSRCPDFTGLQLVEQEAVHWHGLL